jgi:uncharacterized protein YbjT (DUF2867 family)
MQERDCFRSAVGDVLISMIDVRDVVGVAVNALTERGHSGNIYVLTSSPGLFRRCQAAV